MYDQLNIPCLAYTFVFANAYEAFSDIQKHFYIKEPYLFLQIFFHLKFYSVAAAPVFILLIVKFHMLRQLDQWWMF